MNPEFRPSRPEEAHNIARFLQEVFDMETGNPTTELSNMLWKYWEEDPDWTGSRGFVIERQQEIVAHGAAIPLSCWCGNRRLRMMHLIDWASHTKSVGSGVLLLKRLLETVDAVVITGGSEMMRKIVPALGFRNYGQVARFGRPLRPLQRLLGEPKPNWRLGPKFVRSVLWLVGAPSPRVSGWRSRRMMASELDTIRMPWPSPQQGLAKDLAIFERTPAKMAHFLRCPSASIEFYVVERDRSVGGYFVLSFVPAQARVADAWMNSSDPEAWYALYQLAVQKAKEQFRSAEIVTLASDDATMRVLQAAGFHERGRVQLNVLQRGTCLPPETRFRFQMLDSDAAYLHDGRNSFWM